MNKFVALLDTFANLANTQHQGERGGSSTDENTPPDLSGLDSQLVEMIMAGEISQCPNCQEFALKRKNLAGRAAKGLLRGFARYARWEQGAMGASHSIVGKSGGLFDSAAADAAFACINCGYSESDGEYLSRTDSM